MARGQKAHVNPVMLAWARKTAHMDAAQAARKIGRTEEELLAWEDENDESLPTLPQARKAAEVYKRPLALFYFPEPPQEFSVLKDFRRVPEDESEAFTPELTFLIRQAQSRQEWMSEFLQSSGAPILDFVNSAKMGDDHQELADRIRQKLGITPDDTQRTPTLDDALRHWIARTEEIGIFVSRVGKLSGQNFSTQEARGFVLSDPYAPFIFLNDNDAKAAQLFTLAHKMVHLWIGESGISNLENNGPIRTAEDRVEVFCNKVAAEILAPKDFFLPRWEALDPDETLEERIAQLSSLLKVSRIVVARRLLDLRKMNQVAYVELVDRYREEWQEEQQQERARNRQRREPAPVFHPLKLNSNGRAFSRVVISAYRRGELSGRDTSRLLDMKLNHIPKQAERLGLPLRGRRLQP